MNPALPDTSMKLGRCVHKSGLFEILSFCIVPKAQMLHANIR